MTHEEKTYTIDQFAELIKDQIDVWVRAFKVGKVHAGCYPINTTQQTLRAWGRTLISVIIMAETGVTQREVDEDDKDPLTSARKRR